MATRTRPAVRPEALRAAAEFPTLDAIFGRRARRFALGAEITGPLAYRSDKEPVPLAYEEEAILVSAATGVTGVVAEEWPFTDRGGRAHRRRQARTRSPGAPIRARSRSTAPSSSGRTTTALFVLPQRDAVATEYAQNQTFDEQHALYRTAIRLQNGRLDIPRRRPNLFKFNEWIVNTRGIDGLHPDLGRDAPVHLRDAPLLRPAARLLPRRQAARQRSAEARS